MQGTIMILDASGHSTIEYDTKTGEGTDKATDALTHAARVNAQVFDTSVSPGVKMVGPTLGATTEMTVVPAFQGG